MTLSPCKFCLLSLNSWSSELTKKQIKGWKKRKRETMINNWNIAEGCCYLCVGAATFRIYKLTKVDYQNVHTRPQRTHFTPCGLCSHSCSSALLHSLLHVQQYGGAWLKQLAITKRKREREIPLKALVGVFASRDENKVRFWQPSFAAFSSPTQHLGCNQC